MKYYSGITGTQLIEAGSATITTVSVNPTSAGKAYLYDGDPADGGVIAAIFTANITVDLELPFYRAIYFKALSGTWEFSVTYE